MMNESDHLTTESMLDFIDFQMPYSKEQQIEEHLRECEACRYSFRECLVLVSGVVKASSIRPIKESESLTWTSGDSGASEEVPLYQLVDRILLAYVILERFAKGCAWVQRQRDASKLFDWIKACILSCGDLEVDSELTPTDDELVNLTSYLTKLVRAVDTDPRYCVYPLRALAHYLTTDESTVAQEIMAAFVASDLILKRLGLQIDRTPFIPILQAIEDYEIHRAF